MLRTPIKLNPRMPGPSTPTRLCYSCRHDLLRLFECGFTSATKGTHLQLGRNTLRSFSDSRRLRSAPARNNRSEEGVFKSTGRVAQGPNHTEPLDAQESPAKPRQGLTKLEAKQIKEFRRQLAENAEREVLGLPPVEYDDVPLEEEEDSALSELPDPPPIEDKDSIELLRGTGASKDAIVREARQRFGQVLPERVLTKDEYAQYFRLYGEPDLEEIEVEEDEADDAKELLQEQELLRENGDVVEGRNDLDEIEAVEEASMQTQVSKDNGTRDVDKVSWQPGGTMEDRIRDIAQSLGGEVYMTKAQVDKADDESEEPDGREHPLTKLGRFATSPRTVFLPQETFVKPVEKILADYSNKHLKEMCEKTFGGGGLPDSPLTPQSSTARQRQQVAVPIDASQHVMGEMEANAYLTAVMPPVYATVLSVLTETRKRLGSSWLRNLIMKEGSPRILDAGAGGAGIIAWNEIVKAEWASLHGTEVASTSPPPAPKAVVLTGSDTLRHRASVLLENTTFVPRLPDYVHTRDSPTLDDSRPVQQRKQFDVIIAPHTLFPLKEEFLRKQHVQNLWSLLSPSSGVLIILEKGIPRGFEAVAAARELLLERYIASPGSESYESPLSKSLSQEGQTTPKEKAMIIAPCTTHSKCPMYTIAGIANGRKDFCSFQQKFIRPSYLQRVMEGSHWNDEDVKFSYLAVLKGEDLRVKKITSWDEMLNPTTAGKRADQTPILSPEEAAAQSTKGFDLRPRNRSNPLPSTEKSHRLDALAQHTAHPLTSALPRLIFHPMKRKGHVTMDVCTPAGHIERWTVPRSFSPAAYHDARKSRWGDLWALGAKTVVERNLRCGTSGTKEGRKMERKRRRVEEREEVLVEKAEEEALRGLEVGDGDEGEDGVFVEEGEELEDEDDEDDDDLEDPFHLANETPNTNSPINPKALEAKVAEWVRHNSYSQPDPQPQPTSSNKKPIHEATPAQSRLAQTLDFAGSDDELGAALREWEEEFAADRRAAEKKKERDGRKRERGGPGGGARRGRGGKGNA